MEIKSIDSPEFRAFGEVVEGYDFTELLDVLKKDTHMPDDGVHYIPGEPALEKLPIFEELQDGVFGGLSMELGYCNGHNTKLNCLEYHRGSELNVPADDVILMLAKHEDITPDFQLDTSKVVAFKVPAGVGVLLYETSLHYAQARLDGGFRVAVGLPKGTNTDKPDIKIRCAEDKLLWARNKWLLAHKDTSEAEQGAWVGLQGINIDLAEG